MSWPLLAWPGLEAGPAAIPEVGAEEDGPYTIPKPRA